jgi:hypothetical protein
MLSASITILIALMMEAASIRETSGNFCHTALRNIPQDSHLQFYSLFTPV